MSQRFDEKYYQNHAKKLGQFKKETVSEVKRNQNLIVRPKRSRPYEKSEAVQPKFLPNKIRRFHEKTKK